MVFVVIRWLLSNRNPGLTCTRIGMKRDANGSWFLFILFPLADLCREFINGSIISRKLGHISILRYPRWIDLNAPLEHHLRKETLCLSFRRRRRSVNRKTLSGEETSSNWSQIPCLFCPWHVWRPLAPSSWQVLLSSSIPCPILLWSLQVVVVVVVVLAVLYKTDPVVDVNVLQLYFTSERTTALLFKNI